jgi:hypothetical protein
VSNYTTNATSEKISKPRQMIKGEPSKGWVAWSDAADACITTAISKRHATSAHILNEAVMRMSEVIAAAGVHLYYKGIIRTNKAHRKVGKDHLIVDLLPHERDFLDNNDGINRPLETLEYIKSYQGKKLRKLFNTYTAQAVAHLRRDGVEAKMFGYDYTDLLDSKEEAIHEIIEASYVAALEAAGFIKPPGGLVHNVADTQYVDGVRHGKRAYKHLNSAKKLTPDQRELMLATYESGEMDGAINFLNVLGQQAFVIDREAAKESLTVSRKKVELVEAKHKEAADARDTAYKLLEELGLKDVLEEGRELNKAAYIATTRAGRES